MDSNANMQSPEEPIAALASPLVPSPLTPVLQSTKAYANNKGNNNKENIRTTDMTKMSTEKARQCRGLAANLSMKVRRLQGAGAGAGAGDNNKRIKLHREVDSQNANRIQTLPNRQSNRQPLTDPMQDKFIRTNDEIHSDISLCPVMAALIDTPHFQRLKGLNQLGTSQTTYINANHSRFEHSLGVANISKLFIQRIRQMQPQLGVTTKDVLCVTLAGLLHDIGHGPYSHVYDGKFPHRLRQYLARHPHLKQHYHGLPPSETSSNWCHEDASVMMIDAILEYYGLEIDETDLDAPLKPIHSQRHCQADYHRFKDPAFFRVYAPNPSDPQSQGSGWAGHHGYNANGSDHDHRDFSQDLSLNLLSQPSPSSTQRSPSRSSKTAAADNFNETSLVMTSRDWIFIKEMILHEPWALQQEIRKTQYKTERPYNLPLPLLHFEDEEILSGFVGRPLRSQEFLYDIVANRHHGLDTDKMDYFARDERRTQKGNGEFERRIIQEALVAWGTCPKPHKCFACKKYGKRLHLMIVWPVKCAEMICGFFHKRFRNHSQVYTHRATQASTYMICDILTLADPFYRIQPLDFQGKPTKDRSLPISRAMMDPNAYRLLKDSIIDVLEANPSPDLNPAKELIARFKARDLYKCVATKKLRPHHNSWPDRYIWQLQEMEIAQELVKMNGRHLRPVVIPGGQSLSANVAVSLTQEETSSLSSEESSTTPSFIQLDISDIIVEKLGIHSGAKDTNPLNHVRFLRKFELSMLNRRIDDLPLAIQLPEEDYEAHLPRSFMEYSLRIYCTKPEKRELLQHVFEHWWHGIRDEDPTQYLERGTQSLDNGMPTTTQLPAIDEAYNSHSGQRVIHRLTQEPDLTPAPHCLDEVCKASVGEDISPRPIRADFERGPSSARRDLGFLQEDLLAHHEDPARNTQDSSSL